MNRKPPPPLCFGVFFCSDNTTVCVLLCASAAAVLYGSIENDCDVTFAPVRRSFAHSLYATVRSFVRSFARVFAAAAFVRVCVQGGKPTRGVMFRSAFRVIKASAPG